ncbi:MAG: guanylate kinase [Bacteroidales bacterium]
METQPKGKLVVFSAPSGAGKTTIVRHLLECGLNLEFSVSAASRKMRPNEIHGKDYYFITAEDFKQKIANNEFLEWEEVYHDHFYGTLKSEVQRIWGKGNHVIFDVDVVGGLNIKKHYGEKALAVFVMPPHVKELENRLRGRSTESEENLKKRIEKAEDELGFAKEFDKTIVNDDLQTALKEAEGLVRDFLKA